MPWYHHGVIAIAEGELKFAPETTPCTVTASVATSIILTVLLPNLSRYALVPSGVIAIARGELKFAPETTPVVEFVVISIITTSLLP